MRFELTTLTLARLCSTPELRPHSNLGLPLGSTTMRAYMPNRIDNCNPYFHAFSQRPRHSEKPKTALGFCTAALLGVRLDANNGTRRRA